MCQTFPQHVLCAGCRMTLKINYYPEFDFICELAFTLKGPNARAGQCGNVVSSTPSTTFDEELCHYCFSEQTASILGQANLPDGVSDGDNLPTPDSTDDGNADGAGTEDSGDR